MSRFGKDGYQVIYVDTVGLRSPKWKDLWRILGRIRNVLFRSQSREQTLPEGIEVFSPFILPFLNSRLACYLNVKWLVYKLNKRINSSGNEKPIFWIYLPTWTVYQCLKRIPHQLLVYNSIDALEKSPDGVSLNYAFAEAEILKDANLVITTSETLFKEKSLGNKNTQWVPSGVESHWFESRETAKDITMFSKPRIGFFGAIDHRLDLELIHNLAQRYKDWSFIFIGIVRCDVSRLQNQKNIHFLGAKPHFQLVDYVTGLDVIFLPYIKDQFTYYVQPAKLYECLAVGKPVVATRLPSLEAFKDIVHLAEGIESFDTALNDALAENNPELQAERREIARANSWERRHEEILTLMKDAMS